MTYSRTEKRKKKKNEIKRLIENKAIRTRQNYTITILNKLKLILTLTFSIPDIQWLNVGSILGHVTKHVT